MTRKGEISKAFEAGYGKGYAHATEDVIEKTKKFLKNVIPVYEHPNTIIEEYVKYMEDALGEAIKDN